MLTHCHHWELERTFPPLSDLNHRLKEIGHNEALLVLAKTSFPPDWNQGYFHVLVDGPSRFIRLFLTTPPAPTALDPLRHEHQGWLQEFPRLRATALEGGAWQAEADSLTQRILTQINHEEAVLFPQLEAFLRTTRPTQEMRYEHSGIRHFLPNLSAALSSERGSKDWERFSLDLIHLLEHHIEHEERGLYPVHERLVRD